MLKSPQSRRILLLALAMAALQLLACAVGRSYYLTQLTMAAYTAVVVMGLSLLMGYAGQVSLGHAAFVALGGYTSALLTTADLTAFAGRGIGALLYRSGILVTRSRLFGQSDVVSVSPWAAFLAAVLLTAAIAAVVGYPALRLRGHYLAMATLGFGLIVYRVLLVSDFTGAADGVSGIPAWSVLPVLRISAKPPDRVPNYYVACGLVLLALLFLLNVVNSRAGRALRAIHGGETAAGASGVNTGAYKLRAFVLSAVFAAAAGSFLAHYTGSVSPGDSDGVAYIAPDPLDAEYPSG